MCVCEAGTEEGRKEGRRERGMASSVVFGGEGGGLICVEE